jgi:hypothetical protein
MHFHMYLKINSCLNLILSRRKQFGGENRYKKRNLTQFLYSVDFTSTASVVYRSEFLATDPGVQVRPDFMKSDGSGTGSTQPRENN